MKLNELRMEIDSIDDQMVALFCRRMEVASRIAEYKVCRGLPIYQPARELEKLDDLAAKAGPEMARYTKQLYTRMFELSREYQARIGEVKE